MAKGEVVKRTFAAALQPSGSEKRKLLNESAVTSEYMKIKKYVGPKFIQATETTNAYVDERCFTSKTEAELFAYTDVYTTV